MTDAVPGLERVREAASARSLDIEIRERPVAKSLHEAAEILGIAPAGIVKTLVVKRSDDTSRRRSIGPTVGRTVVTLLFCLSLK